MPRYEFGYGTDTVYARVVGLAQRHFVPGGVVLDVGCGHGAVAEPLEALGYTYIGVDIDEGGLKDLADRGLETAVCDLSAAGALLTVTQERLVGRKLSGLLLIDCLEHVVDGVAALDALREVASEWGGAPLIISVPNVTHVDLGIKLLSGRWDYTEVGLLDDTHVAFFDERQLASTTARSGWTKVGSADFELFASDQHFPADSVLLAPSTTISSLLRRLRDMAAPGGEVNQWVRAYVPARPAPAPDVESRSPAPFLSVLMRTQGQRLDTLQEALLCLAAQDCDDFEVLLLLHDVAPLREGDVRYLVEALPGSMSARVRLVPVAGGGRCRPLNVGVTEARGRYLAVLDDDDLVLAHWVQTFRDLGDRWPGRVLRTAVATQDIERTSLLGRPGYVPVGRTTTPYPLSFDLFEHIRENQSPPCGLAFPRSLFRDLGLRFDETLPVLEDWDVLLQAAPLCGVADTPEITAVYRRWVQGESSSTVHTPAEWSAAHAAIIAKLDTHAQVLPRGTLARVRQVLSEIDEAHQAVEAEISTTLAVAAHRDLQLRTVEQLQGDNQALRIHVTHLETLITQEREQWSSERQRLGAEHGDLVAVAAASAGAHARDELRREFHASHTWRLAGPLRRASRVARRVRTARGNR